MSRIVGIDLGTTNQPGGLRRGGAPGHPGRRRSRAPALHRGLYPGGVLVGDTARRQLVRNPARTIYSVKRLMGRGYEDVRGELTHLPFEVVPAAEVVRIRVGSAG